MNPPDDSRCWTGDWTTPAPEANLWAHAAVLRTVAALPSLHAWRLGDDKGSRRSLLWCATPARPAVREAGDYGNTVAVLTQSAPAPSLPLGNADAQGDLLTGPAVRASFSPDPGPRPAPPFRPTSPGVRRWTGGVAQVPGSWLPALAILPMSRRDIDDPATTWATESLAFAERHTVHAADTRFAADVLAPHVTALILDQVPDDAAVTVAGDAVHVWWEYTQQSSAAVARVGRTVEIASRLRDAIPTFVLKDHPDHSHHVEQRLAERAAQAAAYRAARTTGANQDPTLQRIYAKAQADYEAGLAAD